MKGGACRKATHELRVTLVLAYIQVPLRTVVHLSNPSRGTFTLPQRLLSQGETNPSKMDHGIPDIAVNSTFSALERGSKFVAAPEPARSVLQHSKSHPRMLESMYPCHVSLSSYCRRFRIGEATINAGRMCHMQA